VIPLSGRGGRKIKREAVSFDVSRFDDEEVEKRKLTESLGSLLSEHIPSDLRDSTESGLSLDEGSFLDSTVKCKGQGVSH